MAEMKVFVINLDEQEKDTGCAWFTLPCNIEALKQSIGLPPDSDRYLISDYDFPFEILQDTDLDLLNNVCLAISESEIPHEDIPAIQREVKAGKETVRTNIRQEQQVKSVARKNQTNVAESISNHKKSTVQKTQVNGKSARKTVTKQSEKGRKK